MVKALIESGEGGCNLTEEKLPTVLRFFRRGSAVVIVTVRGRALGGPEQQVTLTGRGFGAGEEVIAARAGSVAVGRDETVVAVLAVSDNPAVAEAETHEHALAVRRLRLVFEGAQGEGIQREGAVERSERGRAGGAGQDGAVQMRRCCIHRGEHLAERLHLPHDEEGANGHGVCLQPGGDLQSVGIDDEDSAGPRPDVHGVDTDRQRGDTAPSDRDGVCVCPPLGTRWVEQSMAVQCTHDPPLCHVPHLNEVPL